MKKIMNLVLITSVLVFNVGCVGKEETIRPLSEKEFLKVDFKRTKSTANSKLYILINQKKNTVNLYTKELQNENNITENNITKGIMQNDEVKDVISEGRVNSNDEVCMRSDSKIKEVTIVGLNDDAIIDMRTKSCIPLSKIKELDGYKLNLKNEDGIDLTIYIENGDFSKEKSSL